MFDKLLTSAFDSGSEVFVYMKGFSNPLRGRIQDIDGKFFTLFQNGKSGTILWAFKFSDILSCGLLVGPPSESALAFSFEDEDEAAEVTSSGEEGVA